MVPWVETDDVAWFLRTLDGPFAWAYFLAWQDHWGSALSKREMGIEGLTQAEKDRFFGYYEAIWRRNLVYKHATRVLAKTSMLTFRITEVLQRYPDAKLIYIIRDPVEVIPSGMSLIASVLAAYAIERLRFRGSRYVGMSIFLAYLVPPSILFIPLAAIVYKLQLFDSRLALILTYPTFLIPFCTWLLMGYFKSIPYELEECALIDGASRWQILTKIVLPLAVPGLISAFIFCFTLCWNEFIYALTFLSSTQNKTVPVAIVNEFVDGDIYRWGSLMAGALVVSWVTSSIRGAQRELGREALLHAWVQWIAHVDDEGPVGDVIVGEQQAAVGLEQS